MTVNRISYLPGGIIDVVPAMTRKATELHMRYADGSTYIAVLTNEQAEALYDRLRWHVEGAHRGTSPAS